MSASESDANIDGFPADTEALREVHLRELGLMLVGIAHELNTPLGVVISTIDGLQRCRQKFRDVLDKPSLDADDHANLRAILEHMESGAPVLAAGLQRMEALVRELRLQGRAGDHIAMEPASLTEILEGNLLLMHYQLKQGVSVERNYHARPTVQAHPVFLGQAFLNLIRNAVQAMDGRGTLTLTVRETDGRAEVQVADTGHGIPADVLGRLFRVDVTTKCAAEGTGIGLMHTRKIIDRHGGAITAANGPGGGAVFTVTLPVV